LRQRIEFSFSRRFRIYPQTNSTVSGPFEQKSDPLPIYKDEPRWQGGNLVPAKMNPDELAIAKDKEDADLLPDTRSRAAA
jgi:hypothetical protein